MTSSDRSPGAALHGGVERLGVRWHDTAEARARGFDLSFYRVGAGDRCTLHVHTGKTETWFFVHGRAQVTRGDETIEATAGDAVRTSPGTPHGLVNVGDDDVVFVNLVETESDVEVTTVELEAEA